MAAPFVQPGILCPFCQETVLTEERLAFTFSLRCKHAPMGCYGCLGPKIRDQINGTVGQCLTCSLPSMPLLLHALQEAAEQTSPTVLLSIQCELHTARRKPWTAGDLPEGVLQPVTMFFIKQWAAAVEQRWFPESLIHEWEPGMPPEFRLPAQLLERARRQREQIFAWHESLLHTIRATGKRMHQALDAAVKGAKWTDERTTYLQDRRKGMPPLQQALRRSWGEAREAALHLIRLLDLHLCGWTSGKSMTQWYLATLFSPPSPGSLEDYVSARPPSGTPARDLTDGESACWTVRDLQFLVRHWLQGCQQSPGPLFRATMDTAGQTPTQGGGVAPRYSCRLLLPRPVERPQEETSELEILPPLSQVLGTERAVWECFSRTQPGECSAHNLIEEWPHLFVWSRLPEPAQQDAFTRELYRSTYLRLQRSQEILWKDLSPTWGGTTTEVAELAYRLWLAEDLVPPTSPEDWWGLAVRLCLVLTFDQSLNTRGRLERLMRGLIPPDHGARLAVVCSILHSWIPRTEGTRTSELWERLQDARGEAGARAGQAAFEWITTCAEERRRTLQRAVWVNELLLFQRHVLRSDAGLYMWVPEGRSGPPGIVTGSVSLCSSVSVGMWQITPRRSSSLHTNLLDISPLSIGSRSSP